MKSEIPRNESFHSRRDIRRFWLKVRDVPRRSEGRAKKQYERFYLGLYLLALADHQLLAYPFQVLEDESPDFMLTWESGETVGLEISRATDEEIQAAISRAERENPTEYAIAASPHGYSGDQIEEEFCSIVRESVEKKVAKFDNFKPASRYDLLIPDDTRMGVGNRKKVLTTLTPWVRELTLKKRKLGKVSVVASLDVIYAIGEESRVFPYIAWSAPNEDRADDGEGFSDRVEHAGRMATDAVIHEHKTAGRAIYFIDARGRLVKQTPEGRRFEVCVNHEGEETTLRELLPGG